MQPRDMGRNLRNNAIWAQIVQAYKLRDGPATRQVRYLHHRTLKTLTSLNKEARPFFLGDNSVWSVPLQHLEVLKAIFALRS